MYASDARDDDLCIVEGRLSIEVLLDSPYEPVSLLVAERLADDPLVAAFPGDVLIASQDVINEVVGFDMHRGIVACARRGAGRSLEEVTRDARCVVVAECVNDPENLGALFRNAAAFGVDAVLLDPATVDPLSRRVIRVSMGHALRVAFARGAMHDVFAALAAYTTVALTPSAATDVADVNAERIALFVGNEGEGLDQRTLARADVLASIPMAKGVDSLNVATAAAVALALLRRGRL
jgi:tRNA G18 (ribose-2'-O)-methylase SpoU